MAGTDQSPPSDTQSRAPSVFVTDGARLIIPPGSDSRKRSNLYSSGKRNGTSRAAPMREVTFHADNSTIHAKGKSSDHPIGGLTFLYAIHKRSRIRTWRRQ